MATIDSLDIQIAGSAKKANDAIDSLITNLDRLAKSLKIDTSGLSNIGKALNLGELGKSAKTVESQMQKISKSAAEAAKEFQNKFKDIDVKVDFSKPEAELRKFQKQAQTAENSLSRVMASSSADNRIGEIERLSITLAQATNAVKILENHMAGMQTSQPKLDFSITGIEEAGQKVSEVTEKIKTATIPQSAFNYNADAMKAVFGEAAAGIENWAQATQQFGTNAGAVLNQTATKTDELKARTEQFEQSLKKLQIPPINTENLNVLQRELANIEKKYEDLRIELANKIAMGKISANVDDKGFRELREKMHLAEKTAEALREKIKQVQEMSGQTSTRAKKLGDSIKSASKSFVGMASSSAKAIKPLNSLGNSFKSLIRTMLPILGIRQLFNWGKQSIEIASDLTEVQNVVDTTFGDMAYKVEDFAKTSIEQFGMSELSLKQYSSRFQAMGTAMGFPVDKMSDMSLELTKLTADMASFYNVEQKAVAEDLESIFTGTTKPLRQYGIDLTQATLQEWALKNGLDANVQSMSQAEKTMLRYQYVLANTGAAHGDFARTMNTWANQVRILKMNFQQLAGIIGGVLVNAFKPVVKAVNAAMSHIISFAKTISNALGQIFGWKFEESGGGIAGDMEDAFGAIGDASNGAGDLADKLGQAAENAEKLKTHTLGIDELNVVPKEDDLQTGAGGGGAGGTGEGAIGDAVSGALGGQWIQGDSILKAFESEIDTLYKLGEHIGKTLTDAMNGINWDSVYEKAQNFGKGLADFLNGLISPELFGAVGKTIAGALNTAIYAALSFGETFDFYDFGVSIATGINEFFENFDFKSLAKTLNVWVDGLEETIKGALKNLEPQTIADGLSEFFSEIELDTVLVGIGILKLKKIKKWISGGFEGSSLSGLFSSMFSGGITISGLLLKIGSIMLGFAGTPVGDVTASWILEQLKSSLDKMIPQWVQDILGNIGSGIVVGAVAGSWFPGAGTVAGAIVGGIIGALNGIEIDGKSILKTITDKLFNFDFSIGLFEEAKKAFERAFSGNEKWYDIGKDILLGIGNGIVGALAFLVEPIMDLFDWTWEVICDVFGIHSPAATMYPIGENILFGIIEGFKSVWNEITTILNDWYENKIKPWFTLDKWKKLGEKVKGGFSDVSEFFGGVWEKIKKTFSPTDGWFKEKFDNAYKNVTIVFTPINTWFHEKWDAVKGVFRDVLQFFTNKFTSAYNAVKNAFNQINIWFHEKWDAVKGVFKDVLSFFSDKFTGGYNAVKKAFGNIVNWFGEKWDGIKNVFSGLTSWFSTAFRRAYDAVTLVWDGIKSYFAKVANWIIDPIERAINGVIRGINWVFEAVGAKAPLSEWQAPRFASGSNGIPKDTLGMVNDQKGATYKELIVPPHGKPFIPEGRNVLLPLEKGTKIMPANQTKMFVNSLPNIPKFANGIGDFFGGAWEKITNFTGSVLDYIANPGKIVQIAIDKFTDFSNVGNFFIPIATSAINKLFDSVVKFVGKMFDSFGGAEKAVKWALGIAADNSHGYDQGNRWGNPDYDCSSLVISAFEQAGIKLKSAGATYTGNMYNVARGLGFTDVTSSVNLSTGSGMKRGDILLNRQNHTAMYIGNGQVVQASSNERGGIRGGIPGDQTGREINVSPYYNYPWDDVLRYAKAYKKGIGKINLSDLIPAYLHGGFPEDGLFFANHNELVGQFSNGQTVVGNNIDIQKGIEEAAYRGFSRANSENTKQEELLKELIRAVQSGKKIVIDGREIVSAYDERKTRNGYVFT